MFEKYLSVQRIDGRNEEYPYIEWRIKASCTTFRVIHASNLLAFALDNYAGNIIYDTSTGVIKSVQNGNESESSNFAEFILQKWNSEFEVSWKIDELLQFLLKI